MPFKSVLVVEDDPHILADLIQIFEMENFVVLIAKNGKEAIDILNSSAELPGLVCLDLMMPIMDGKTMMETIDKHYKERFGMIPVLIASAKGSLIEQTNILQSVVRIQKPFDLDQLYEAVEKYCGKPIQRIKS